MRTGRRLLRPLGRPSSAGLLPAGARSSVERRSTRPVRRSRIASTKPTSDHIVVTFFRCCRAPADRAVAARRSLTRSTGFGGAGAPSGRAPARERQPGLRSSPLTLFRGFSGTGALLAARAGGRLRRNSAVSDGAGDRGHVCFPFGRSFHFSNRFERRYGVVDVTSTGDRADQGVGGGAESRTRVFGAGRRVESIRRWCGCCSAPLVRGQRDRAGWFPRPGTTRGRARRGSTTTTSAPESAPPRGRTRRCVATTASWTAANRNPRAVATGARSIQRCEYGITARSRGRRSRRTCACRFRDFAARPNRAHHKLIGRGHEHGARSARPFGVVGALLCGVRARIAPLVRAARRNGAAERGALRCSGDRKW